MTFGTAGDGVFEARKEVYAVDGEVGAFFLATSVEGHAAETLVQVTVSAVDPSQLALDFSDHHHVLTDACVLLCGHTGAVKLLELGYTGTLAIRPQLAARSGSKPPDADSAPSTTEPMRQK